MQELQVWYTEWEMNGIYVGVTSVAYICPMKCENSAALEQLVCKIKKYCQYFYYSTIAKL